MSSPAYSLTDLVAVLLQSIAEKEPNKKVLLSEDPSKLHWAFYELKKKWAREFPPLAQLHFVTAGPFPYSHDLNEVLDTLQSSDELARINPHYTTFAPATYEDTGAWLTTQQQEIAGSGKRKKAFDVAVRELHVALVRA